MNHVKLATRGLLVLLIVGCLVSVSESQRGRRAGGRSGGPVSNVVRLFRFQQRRNEQEDTQNKRACFALSGLFQRRECMRESNAICTMYSFLIKNAGYECQQFPCNGYGSDSRSICVPKGECTRLTLSNGLCTQDTECCIPANE